MNEKLLKQLGDGEDKGAKRHGGRIRKAFVGRLSGRERGADCALAQASGTSLCRLRQSEAVLGVTLGAWWAHAYR